VTAKYGAVLIFDEVMTGFRVAKGGVQEVTGVMPDLTCLGKVIGGGLPVGAFGGKAEIMDCLAPLGAVYQAGTLSGNPLAMAAGLAQLKELDRKRGWDELEVLGARFEAGVRDILAEKGVNFQFNRLGSMFCLFFTENEIVNVDDATGADVAAFKRYFAALLEDGIFMAPSPYESGFLSLAHSTGDIDDTLGAMREAMKVV